MSSRRMLKLPKLSLKTLALPLLLLGLGLLTTISTLLTQPGGGQQRESLAERSIYNNGPSGYRAWFLAAQKSGLPIKSWENPFTDLDSLPKPATMIIIKPYTVANAKVIFGRRDADELIKWVAAGNTLVILDDFRRFGSNSLGFELNLDIERPKRPKGHGQTPSKSTPKPLDLVAKNRLIGAFIQQPLLSRNALALTPLPGNSLMFQPVLENQKGETVLMRMRYKEGHLLIGAIEDFAENGYLNKPQNDNFQLFTNLLMQEGNPVFVNEFVHGYVQAGDLLSYYQQKTPLGNIFAQLVLFFFALLWLSFVRWTPKPKEGDLEKRSGATNGSGAYIRSLAGLYYRAKAAPLALEPQLQRINTLLRKRFRVNPDEEARLLDLLHTPPGDYSNREESPQRLVLALQSAQKAVASQTTLPHRDLLKLSRQLTVIEERLQHGHRTQFSIR